MIRFLTYLFLLFQYSCTDLILHESTYHSLSFNGGAWIEFNGLDLQNDFTIELWTTGGQIENIESPALFSIGDQNSTQFALYRHPNIKSEIMVDINNEVTNTNISSLENVDSDTFNFISLIKNDDTLTIYINGIEFKKDIQVWNTIGMSLYIGTVPYLTNSNFWIGVIDEIRYWDLAISDDILEFHFNNPDKLFESENSEIEGNLISIWRLEYTEPSTIVSDSNNNIDGIIKTLPGYSVELSTKSAQ